MKAPENLGGFIVIRNTTQKGKKVRFYVSIHSDFFTFLFTFVNSVTTDCGGCDIYQIWFGLVLSVFQLDKAGLAKVLEDMCVINSEI